MRPENRGEDEELVRPEQGERQRITDVLSVAAAAVEVDQVPEALCRACVELLPVTGASVSLGHLSSLSGDCGVSVTLCASDAVAAGLAEAQYTLGDGPSRRAQTLGAPVLAADLTSGPDARRWPVFAQQAVELGGRAVFSLPLGTGALAIGTLDLYRDRPGVLSERDLRIALLVRDAVTFAVSNLQAGSGSGFDQDDGGVASWVEAAEADHVEVHQAVGMVMVQLGVDPDQALDRLRARAFAQGRTVSEVARDVVARTFRFPDAEGTPADHDDSPDQDHGRHGDREGDSER